MHISYGKAKLLMSTPGRAWCLHSKRNAVASDRAKMAWVVLYFTKMYSHKGISCSRKTENLLPIICTRELSRSYTRIYRLICFHCVRCISEVFWHRCKETHIHTQPALRSISARGRNGSSYTAHRIVVATTWSAGTWERSNSKTFAIYFMS